MTALITIDDIKSVKPISQNIDVQKKLNTFIIEAQDFDLKPLLGDELFILMHAGLTSSPQEQIMLDIWNEKIYTKNSVQYISHGLKKVLCFYSWARYELNANTQQTAFGAVDKSNQYSKSSDYKIIQEQVAQARAGAVAYQNSVLQYIIFHASVYPKWRGGNFDSQASSGIKINSIGGNTSRKIASSYRCRQCGKYTGCTCINY